MARIVVGTLVFLLGCATQQHASSGTINGWTPVQQAELHGRCVGGWLAHRAHAALADALCTCVTPHLARTFSSSWLTDGRAVTPEEVQAINDIQRSCVRELALAPGGEGTRERASEAAPDDGVQPGVAEQGTGSGEEL